MDSNGKVIIFSKMSEPSRAPVAFPSTLWSEVIALQGNDQEKRRERLDHLVQRYWKPVYWALRTDCGQREEEARDLTQEFFVRVLEGRVIEGVDPERGSFRNYLKGALRNFLMNERRKGQTEKRGGGRRHLSINFDGIGPEPAGLGADPEKALDRAWTMQILDDALAAAGDQLIREGRERELRCSGSSTWIRRGRALRTGTWGTATG